MLTVSERMRRLFLVQYKRGRERQAVGTAGLVTGETRIECERIYRGLRMKGV